ncbi:MAG: FHA domain-containing protein [Planctomycetaceae bacterium]
MAALQQIFGTPPLPVHRFNGHVATIGRHEDCDVVVDSPAVSRCHARIICDNQRYFIEDLNSRNGTTVNAKRIHSRTLLNDGDLVGIATLPFRFLSLESGKDDSGEWRRKPSVISLSHSDDEDDSARRLMVRPGDRVSSEELGSEPLRPSQLIGRIQVADNGTGWPVVDHAAVKLSHCLRLLHALRQTVTPDEIISRTLQELFDAFPAAERIAVIMRDDHPSDVHVAAAVTRRSADEVRICLPVVRTSMQNCEALLYAEHWRGAETPVNVGTAGTVLVAPLVGFLGHSIGAVQLDCSEKNLALSNDDLERLVVLCLVVSFALEQAESLENRIVKAIRDRDTFDANQLQAEFTPSTPPVVSGYRVTHELLTGPRVAGDLVDYVRLSDGRVAVLVIDVPGRDSEAARMMALLARLLIGNLAETGSAAQTIIETERMLRQRVDGIPAQTSVAIMILDRDRSEVTVSVAGCCPLFLVRASEVQEVSGSHFVGPAMGDPRFEPIEGKLLLNDNDILLIFNDGITKLTSTGGHVLTASQRLTLIAEAAAENRTVFESRLKRRLKEFRGDESLMDDLIFAVIHRHKDAGTIDAQGLRGIDADTMGT